MPGYTVGPDYVSQTTSVSDDSGIPPQQKKVSKGWSAKDTIGIAPFIDTTTKVPPPQAETLEVDDIPFETAKWSKFVPANSDDFNELFDITMELYRLEFMINKEQKTLYMLIQRQYLDEHLKHGLMSAESMRSTLSAVLQIGSGVFATVAGGVRLADGNWLRGHLGGIMGFLHIPRGTASQAVEGVSGVFQGVGSLCGESGKINSTFNDANSQAQRTISANYEQKLRDIQSSLQEVKESRDTNHQRRIEETKRHLESIQSVLKA